MQKPKRYLCNTDSSPSLPFQSNENDKIVYCLPRKPACFSQSIYISATILKLLFYKLCYESVVASYDIW